MAFTKSTKRFLKYYKTLKEIHFGGIVLKRIYKEFSKDIVVCVSQHPAMGDAYLAGLYLNTFYKGREFVVTAISSGTTEIYHDLGVKNIYRLSQRETDCFIQYCQFMGITEERVRILHHQSLKWHTGIAWNFHGIKGLNFADIFEAMVFPEMKREDRKYLHSEECVDKNCLYKLEKGKTFLLFPYSNTLYAPNAGFWEKLTDYLKGGGYCVATYVFAGEKPIEGSMGISCRLRELPSLAEYAGNIIGARNGLADIISRAKCRKIILYPSKGAETWIFGKIIDFWSLNGFGYAEDIEEYEWETISISERGVKCCNSYII